VAAANQILVKARRISSLPERIFSQLRRCARTGQSVDGRLRTVLEIVLRVACASRATGREIDRTDQ